MCVCVVMGVGWGGLVSACVRLMVRRVRACDGWAGECVCE